VRGIGPAGLRVWHERAFWLLMVVTAGLLFGGSGIALAVLCHALPRHAARSPGWESVLAARSLSFAYVGPWRLVLCARGVGRAVVYRDEVPPATWARLRRGGLGCPDRTAQPATGRSTSS
jgi:hypothetical protein